MRKILALVVGLSLWASVAAAGPSNYVPLPDYNTGNAIPGFSPGRSQTEDTNRHLNGTSAIEPKLTHYVFANLPSEVDYKLAWCDDCAATNPCTGGGAGPAVLAYGFSGAWVCSLGGGGGGGGSSFPLGADVSGATLYTITHLRDAATSHEPITYGQPSAQLTVNQNTTSLISTGSVPTGSTTPNVITAPATITSGNALVLAIQIFGGPPTITPPSGFSLIRSTVSGTVAQASYCKTATGSEPGTYSISFTGGGPARSFITQLADTDCSHIDGSTGGVAAYPTLPTIAGVATLHTNDLILAVGSMNCGDTPQINTGKVFYNDNTIGLLVGSWRLQPSIGTSTTATIGQVPANCAGGAVLAGQQIAFAPKTTIQSGVIVSGQSGVNLGSLSASVNGVLNVMASPYGALGDGTTDDTAAIQQCIYDACGATPPASFPVSGATASCYLPPTKACYMHSAPIRIPCLSLELYGASDLTSKLCQNYAGDAIIQNGWGISNLPYTGALVGSGNSLISPGPIQVPNLIDVARWVNGPGSNNFASKVTANGFNISFYMKRTAANGIVLMSREAYPGSLGHDQFQIGLNASSGTAIAASVYTAAAATVSLAACAAQTSGTVYEVELDWDKTNYRLWQGLPGGTAVICDTQASSSPPISSPFFEWLLPPGGHHQYWPDGSSTVDNPFAGDLDAVWIRTHSKHTTAYTVPNAKPVSDSDTYYLNNFETSLDGTQIAHHGSNNQAIYQTVLSGNVGSTASVKLHDLELCAPNSGNTGQPDGLFASSGNGSRHWNLACSNAYWKQFEEFSQMYIMNADNLHGFGGHVGFIKGAQFSGSHVSYIGSDGTDVACEVGIGGGGGNYSEFTPTCVDRGSLLYGWVDYLDSATILWPFVDQEATNTSFKATFLLDAPGAPYSITGGNIDTRNGAPYILQDNGGYGSNISTLVFNTFGEDQPAVDIIKFTNGNPLSRTVLNSSFLPVDVPISNSPQYVKHGPGCNGLITLASGIGQFSDQCIYPSDVCFGQDTTTPGTAFTLGIPSAGRTVSDGVFNSTTTVTSATMAFVSGDVGRKIYGTSVPTGDFIASVSSGTTVILNAATTATGTARHITLGPIVNITSGTGTDVIAVNCQ